MRTIPSLLLDDNGVHSIGDNEDQNEPAAVHTTSTPFETAHQSALGKEVNAVQQQAKRVVSGRRNSPATSSGEQGAVQSSQTGSSDEDESPKAIQKLTERLNFLRVEKERMDKEIADDDEESRRNLGDLTKERDRLKQEYRDKEETSAELRRHGNYLDKVNRTAQSRKAAKEKQLQQKKADRQKLKDDIERWENETIKMRRDTEDMDREKNEILAARDSDIADIRKRTAEDLAAIKLLEEDIRVTGAQIKAIEKESEKMNTDESDEQEQTGIDRETDQAWEARMQTMQSQLASMWQNLQQALLEQHQAEDHLAWWIARRARNPEQFAPIPALDFTSSIQPSRSRRSRQPNSRTSTISSPSAGYHSGSAALSHVSTISPPFPAASPFFNIGNGATVSLQDRMSPTQADIEILTGSGPMSPAANSLLPSNLFRDDDIMSHHLTEGIRHDIAGNSGPVEHIFGHALTNSESSVHGPHTPGSTGSHPGSLLSSPQDSSHNLQTYQACPDSFKEGDQRSTNSIATPFSSPGTADNNPLASSRLANLFSSTFNRQREKQGTQEPPLLGTLKQGQSQSFPRNMEHDGLDSNGNRRRKGSHSNWANPMSGFLNRNAGTPESSELITARTGSGRRSRLNMFAPKIDGSDISAFGDHPRPSRPSSTYSYDQILARPSSDSQRFGWPAPETIPNRNSPLGTHSHWASGPWSRAPSRRPSVQHGSTSNLSIGSTPLDPDAIPGPFSKSSSEQAPIGTRPQSSRRPTTPRLNPAAPSFKTLFTRGDAKKSAKGEKSGGRSAEKPKDRDSEKIVIEDVESAQDFSPQDPRLSRDTQSITTATSTTDSHDSFDRSTSGTPSEVVTPSGPKETLIQKISRKSSSSKFNVPWGKERGLFSKRAGEPSTPGEMDEDTPSDNQLGKSTESSSSTPQQEKAGRSSLSWPNIRRKSKKGDQALAEAVERGSEFGEEDDT